VTDQMKRNRQKGAVRKLGYYGTAPLWFQRTSEGTFVLFNDQRIAKTCRRREGVGGHRGRMEGHADWDPGNTRAAQRQ
jgi:hypothetical protein